MDVPKPLKKLAYWSLYVVYLLTFLLAVDYFFFYRPWVKEIEATWSSQGRGGDPHKTALESVPNVDPLLMKRLGKAGNDKASSFVHHAKAKAEGTVRICAFGASYTEGAEVDNVSDFPALLEQHLTSRGARNLEVINFGIGGFGFHQTYLMWESMAPAFDCDVSLLGPRGFEFLRDTHFGFIYGWSGYYLHARYVLDGDDVRLVEVPGETYGDRFRHFFRFIPRWQYLRHHRAAPAFLRALVPKGRELPNPFYYTDLPLDEEAIQTYRVLMNKMASTGKPILIGAYRPRIIDMAREIEAGANGKSFTAELFEEQGKFPYLAPKSHASSLGNDLLARRFADRLLGRGMASADAETISVETISVIDTQPLDWAAEPGSRRPMSSYTDVRIELAGTPVGLFVVPDNPATPATKTDALVSVHGPEEGVLDSAFFPLELELGPDVEVVLKAETAGTSEELPLGRMQVLSGGFNIGHLAVDGFDFRGYKEMQQLDELGETPGKASGEKKVYGLYFSGGPGISMETLLAADTLTVMVGGKPALRGLQTGKGTAGVMFRPIGGALRFVRATPTGLPELDDLAETGVFDLVAKHWEDGDVRVPIAAWKKKAITTSPTDSSPPILSLTADGTARVVD